MTSIRKGARSQLARRLSWLGVISLVSVALFAPSTSSVLAAAPGNNGTVKIEDSVDPKDEPANDPHVCQFDIKFFFADPAQTGDWHIKSWPPTGDKTTVLDGTYDTNGDGFDRQPADGYYSLADGHYKLSWKGDDSKLWKHKVFWVDCLEPEPTATPEPTETPKPTDKPKVDPTPRPTPTGDVAPATGEPRPTSRATLPSTDTIGAASTAPAGDNWRIVLLAMAGVLTAALVLSPARAVARRQDRSR
jgi:hypothetical protein